MRDRPRLIHLIAIALALSALAAAAWLYANANEPVEGIPESLKVAAPIGAPVGRSSCHEKGGLEQCQEACAAKIEADGGKYDGDCYADCDYRCGRADENHIVADIYFHKFRPSILPVDCAEVLPIRSSFPPHGGYGHGEISDEANERINITEEAESALVALLVGPTAEEIDDGYYTSIPEGVRLKSVGIDFDDGKAAADFSKELSAAAGSCRVTAIRAQIEKTLKQFPGVKSVEITIEGGKPSEALQP